jgi:hypothetical protein
MATARKFERVISDAGAVDTVDFSQLPPEYYGFAVSSPQPMYTASSTPGYGGMLANFTSESYALQNNSLGKAVSEVYPIVKTIFGATYVWSEGLTVTCSLPSPS